MVMVVEVSADGQADRPRESPCPTRSLGQPDHLEHLVVSIPNWTRSIRGMACARGMADGRRLQAATTHAKGDPRNPLTLTT